MRESQGDGFFLQAVYHYELFKSDSRSPFIGWLVFTDHLWNQVRENSIGDVTFFADTSQSKTFFGKHSQLPPRAKIHRYWIVCARDSFGIYHACLHIGRHLLLLLTHRGVSITVSFSCGRILGGVPHLLLDQRQTMTRTTPKNNRQKHRLTERDDNEKRKYDFHTRKHYILTFLRTRT